MEATGRIQVGRIDHLPRRIQQPHLAAFQRIDAAVHVEGCAGRGVRGCLQPDQPVRQRRRVELKRKPPRGIAIAGIQSRTENLQARGAGVPAQCGGQVRHRLGVERARRLGQRNHDPSHGWGRRSIRARGQHRHRARLHRQPGRHEGEVQQARAQRLHQQQHRQPPARAGRAAVPQQQPRPGHQHGEREHQRDGNIRGHGHGCSSGCSASR